jgi:hypothetical protein
MAGSTQVVTYRVDDQTTVQFEIEPAPGFGPVAAAGDVIATVTDAVAPTVAAAKAVLDGVSATGPQMTEIRFGVKVTGKDQWSIARTVEEGNFEVTVAWRPRG